jgi:hypothetical protein
MYARLLFVVVGIFGPVLADFPPSTVFPPAAFPELRLGFSGGCGYTLAA